MIGQIDRVAEIEFLKNKNVNHLADNIVSILSGKGGTGKTFLAANSAYLFSKNYGKVLLVELNHNLSNLSSFFNININNTISSFLESKASFSEIITKVSPTLHIIFGDSGKLNKTELTEHDINRIFQNLATLSKSYDLILLDTGSGANRTTLYAASLSNSIILVSTPEPTAIMDAYVISKLLYHNYDVKAISVLFNNCLTEDEGITSYENLQNAVRHFLNISVEHIASIPQSGTVRSSVMNQQLFAKFNPDHEVTAILSAALNKVINNLQLFNINHSQL